MYRTKKSRRLNKGVQSTSARANPVAIAASVAVGALIGEGAQAHNIQVAHIAAGSAKVNEAGLRTTIVAANRTIIDYTRFDVSQFETVQFVLPTIHSSILNRITSADPSHIDGHVIGNGSIYFANPAGVLFGPHAVLNVGNLYAAAGNISNKDFLAGNNHFTVGQGSVVNEGMLKADTVALVGRQVINRGVIVGQSVVTMASGDDVYLGQRDGNVMVQVNSSSAPASAANQEPDLPLGAGDIYSLAITNTGQVKGPGINVQASSGTASISGKLDASNAAGKGGAINITAPQVVVDHATIDASGRTGGGSILVGGDAHGQGTLPNAQQTSVSAGSMLTADATKQGDGGKVVVWSDQSTQAHGAISARGGASGGNGGFVETSGHLLDVSGTSVDTSAPAGKQGNWLLDPGDVTIESASDILGTDVPIVGVVGPSTLTTFDNTVTGSVISFTTINTAINTTDVTVTSAGAIQVKAPSGTDTGITRTTPTTTANLTLGAVGPVTVSGPISSTGGPLNVDIETTGAAGHVNINAPITTAGGTFKSHAAGAGSDFNLNNDGTTTHGSIDTTGLTTGNVALNHSGAVSIGGTINAGGTLDVKSSGTTISANIATVGGQDYHNPVTIAGAPTLKDSTGPINFEDTLDGQATGSSDLTLDTPGLSTFNKDVGGIKPLTSLTVATGPAKSLGAKIVTSGGGQSYAGDLSITAAGTFNLTDTGTTAASTLNFKSTITAGTADVQTSSGGLTTFGGNVGANSLTTAAGGTISLGANVTTSAGQDFKNPVTVAGTPTLKDSSSPIMFENTLDGQTTGSSDLTVDTTGLTTFSKDVGGLQPLTSLSVATGPANSGGTKIITSGGGQSYAADLTIPGTGTFVVSDTGTTAASTLNFKSTITAGGADLQTSSGGITTFGGNVTANSLTTPSTGTTTIDANISTTSAQKYQNAVTLGGNSKLSGSSLAAPSIDGTAINKYNLTLDFSTPILLDGSGSALVLTNLGTLEVKQGATIGGALAPTGPVIFDGPVTLDANTTMTSGTFPVTFGGGVSEGTSDFSFNISTTGTVKLGGAVSVGTLNIAGGQIDLIDGATSADVPAITTLHSQTWTGPIKLFDNTSLTSANATATDTLTFTSINGNDGTSDHSLSLKFGGNLALSDANLSGISTLTVGTLGSSFGTTQLSTSLTTSGPQNFFDPVQITSNVVLKSGNNAVTFGNTIDGPGGLEVDTTATTFLGRSANVDGKIGASSSKLAFIDIPDGPTHVDNLSQMKTTGAQSYQNALTIGTYQWSPISLDSGGDVTFGTSGKTFALEGSTTALSIKAPNVLFFGPVHLSALTATITDPAGSTQIFGGEVKTRHGQTYNASVALTGNPVDLFATTTLLGDSITFASIGANNHPLTVSSAVPMTATTIFNGLGGLHELHYVPFNPSTTDSDLPPDYTSGPLPPKAVGQITDPTASSSIVAEFDIGTSLISTGDLEFDDKARLMADGLTLQAPNTLFHGGLIGGGSVGGPDPVTAIDNLTINANGITLDSSARLGGLTVNSDGAANVTLSSAANVHIETYASGSGSGNQTYLTQLILNADTLLRGNGPTALLTYPLSADAIDGRAVNHNLTLQFTGPTLIDGNFIQNIGNLIVGPVSLADDFTTTSTTKALLKNTITTSGLQLYSQPVVLQGNTIVRNDQTASTPAHVSASPITFGDTVDGSFALTSDTSALTTFDKTVGSNSPLVRLSVITGPAEIDAPSVKTAVDVPGTSALKFIGDLTLYGSNTTVNPTANVSLPAPVLFNDGNGGTVTFFGKLSGAQAASQAWNSNLTIDTTGLTTFSKAVNLGSLDVATGNSEIDGGKVSSAGTGATALGQFYHGSVTLNGGLTPTNNTTALSDNNAGTITIHTTLSGSLAAGQAVDTSLSISSSGTSGIVTFGGAVDVGTLSVTASNVEIDGGSVASNRFAGSSSKAGKIGQLYQGDVTLNGPHQADSTITDAPASSPVSFTDGQAADIIFTGKLNGTVASGASFASMVNVSSNNATASGQVGFGGAVNLGSLKVLNGTSTEIDGGQIATLGLGNGSLPLIGTLPVVGQYYSAPVTLNSGQVILSAGNFSLPSPGSAVSFTDAVGGGITFHSTLAGPSSSSDVQISTTLSGGQITFGGAVSVGSLKVSAGQTEVDGGSVTTSSSAIGQSYNGPVTLNGPHAGDATIVDQLTSILTPPAMGNVKFTDNSAGGITFNNSLTGTPVLQLGFANVTLSSKSGSSVGQITFRGAVDVGSLVVSNGNTEFDGGSVSTHATLAAGNGLATGPDNLGQYYNGSVTLNAQSPAGSASLLSATTLKDTPFTVGVVGDIVLPVGVTDFASTPSAPGGTQHTDLLMQTPGLAVFAGSSSLGSVKVVAGPAEMDGANIATADTGSPVPSSTLAVGQYYIGNVGINNNTYPLLSSSTSNHPVNLSDSGAGAVTFVGQLSGPAGDSDLNIGTKNASSAVGLVTFGKSVNLQALKVLDGNSEIDGGSVTTAGTGAAAFDSTVAVGQYYGGSVLLNGSHPADPINISVAPLGSVSLSDTGGGFITFVGSLSGPTVANLTADSSGLTTFGNSANLFGNLVVQHASEIDGGGVSTGGSQYYGGNATVNGPHLAELHRISDVDPVQLNAGSFIEFRSTVNGPVNPVPTVNADLVLNTPAVSLFAGAVKVSSLKVINGSTEIDGGSVQTSGTGAGALPIIGSLPVGQYYHGPVVLNGTHSIDSTIVDPSNPAEVTLSDSQGGAITFANTLSGSLAKGQPVNSNLTVTTKDGTGTSGQVTFGGAVDLGSLQIPAGQVEIDGPGVNTAGSTTINVGGNALAVGQYYHDGVVLNGPHQADPGIADQPFPGLEQFNDSGAGAITFHSTMTGALNQGQAVDANVDVRTASGSNLGTVTFGGAVELGSLKVLSGNTEIDGGFINTRGTGSQSGAVPAIGSLPIGQYYHNAVVLNGSHAADATIVTPSSPAEVQLTDANGGAITFDQTVHGSTAQGQAINSNLTIGTSGLATFGGAADLGSLKISQGPTEIDGGSVTTAGTGLPTLPAGPTLPVGQFYFGAVTLDGAHLASPSIVDQTSPSTVLFTDTGAGAITFRSTLDGATATGQAINANVDVSTLGSANPGQLTFGGSVVLGSLKVLHGNTEIDGGSVTTFGTGSQPDATPAIGSLPLGQYYHDHVVLNGSRAADPTIALGAGDVTLTDLGSGAITFVNKLNGSAIDGTSSTPAPGQPINSNLVIDTQGLATFGGKVSLGSLKVITGTTEIDGGSIATFGTGAAVPPAFGSTNVGQYYFGNVTVNGSRAADASSLVLAGPAVSLTDANSGSITFMQQLNGAKPAQTIDSDLTIDTAGLATFGGAARLGSLNVKTGPTEIDGGSVATTDGTGQYFHGVVSLNGGSYSLASNNSVTLSDASSGNITFHTTLDGSTSTGQTRNSDLVLDTAGLSTFGGAVTLGSLKVITGPSEIDGGSVTTFGTGSNSDATPTIGTLPPMGQYYHGNVAINGNSSSDPTITPGSSEVLLQDANGGTITFAARLDGATTGAPANQPINSNLTIDSTGLVTVGGAVNIGSLNIKTGPAEIDGGSVTTYGTGSPIAGSSLALGQYYHGLVTINGAHLSDPSISDLNPPPVALSDKGAGAITFHDALFGSTNPAHPQPINSDVAISTENGAVLGQITFGGAVDVGSLDVVAGHTEIDGGSVTTYGTGASHLGQYYHDDVVINGTHAADSTISDLNPPPVALTDQAAGSITFHDVLFGSTSAPQPEPITSDVAITTNQGAALGQVTFGGAVNVGSLQVLAGHTEIDGGSVTTHGTGPTNGAGRTGQYYANDVVINGLHTVDPTISDHNSPPVALSDDAAGTITFHDVLFGSINPAHPQPINSDLVISTSNGGALGQITFGSTVDLGSLKVVAGNTEIDGGSVSTHGTGSPITGSSLAVGQYYHDGVVLNGNHAADPTIVLGGANVSLSDDGLGAITFVATLNGSRLNHGSAAQPVDSNLMIDTKGLTTFGGPVSLGSLDVATGPAEIDGNSITTFGTGPARLGQAYANTVTLNGSHPSDPGIAITSPNVTLLDNGGGTISFLGQLTGSTSDLTVTTSGKTSFENTVTLNSLQTDGGGVTAIDGGNVTTGSYQWYFDAVTLGAPNTILKAGGDVFFFSTVNGSSNLTVQSPGVTRFNDTVNIASLTTDAAGSTAIDGGSIVTTGAQFFGDPVTMGVFKSAPNTQLTAGGPITFGQTLDGSSNLTLTSNSLATFGGKVGATQALSSLTVNAQAEIDGGAVNTSGAQLYNKAVAVNGPHANGPAIHDVNPLSIRAGGPITFVSALNGPAGSSDLLLTSPALTTFGGAVNVGSLEVLQGPSEIDGGSVTTHSTGSLPGSSLAVGQYYRGNVTIDGAHSISNAISPVGPNISLSDTAGAITFAGQLNGSTNLTIDTGGLTTFGGAVQLGSVDVKTGPAEIDGGSIATSGSGANGTGQTYGNIVTLNGNHAADPGIGLNADVTLSDSARGSITFTHTLSGALSSGQPIDSNLNVNTTGLTDFVQAVTLGSLNVSNAGGKTSVDGGQVTTSGSQTFNNPVTITANTTFTSSGGGNIAFEQSLKQSSNQTLTVNTSGQTQFHSNVTVASLTTDAAGSTLIQSDGQDLAGGASTIATTAGDMSFNDSVTVVGNVSLTAQQAASRIVFAQSADFNPGSSAGNVSISTQGGDIVFGSAQTLALPSDPITPGADAPTPTTLATTFGGATVSVATNGSHGSLSFSGPVNFDTAGQLTLSTSNATALIQPLTLNGSGLSGLQLAETGVPTTAAVQATFSSGTSDGTIQFAAPIHANSGSVIVQSDHGNILFEGAVAPDGASRSDLRVGTSGNTLLMDPATGQLSTDVPTYVKDGNVFFQGAVTLDSLQVSGRNILVHDISTAQGITLQPDYHLFQIRQQSTKKGYGPYSVPDPAADTKTPPPDDGLLMIVPSANSGGTAKLTSSSGDVSLARAPRQVVDNTGTVQGQGNVSASVATIIDRAYDPTVQVPLDTTPIHNVTISGADVIMGQNEKLTVLGSITITAAKDTGSSTPDGYSGTSGSSTFEGGVARLSDLSAFDTIKVKADTAIVLQDRQSPGSGAGLTSTGTASDFFLKENDQLGDPDNNLDFFARNLIQFTSPSLKALKQGQLHTANYKDVRFGVDLAGTVLINGRADAPFIEQHSTHSHTKSEFLFAAYPHAKTDDLSTFLANVVLASSASGPSSTTVTAGDITVLAAEMPDVPQGDEQIGKATKDKLLKLGVVVYDPLQPAEMVSRVSSHLDYMEGLVKETPGQAISGDSIAQVAAQRMDKKATDGVVGIYDEIYTVKPEVVRKQLASAWDDYVKHVRQDAAKGFDAKKDAVAFRMLLESGSYNSVRSTIDRMRSINLKFPLIGLTPTQVDYCRDTLLQDIMPDSRSFMSADDDARLQALKQVVFFTATWAKPLPGIDPLPPAYLLNGTIEGGGIRLNPAH